jgi:RimJ/RimL family protein N-acetyltransferase
MLELSAPGLRLTAAVVPWDTEVFGFPVAQIYTLEVTDPLLCATEAYQGFQAWLDTNQVRVASCRLPHDRLRESMFLEAQGFRFVEMVLHPRIEALGGLEIPVDCITIVPAQEADLAALQGIAERAFSHERYHLDPRLESYLADLRYGRWVRNSLNHPRQRLLKVLDGERLVACFIVEARKKGEVYWHLTAVSPEYQGQGYGRRVWQAMLRRHGEEGFESVTTTISARNVAVLNLYARLSFRFLPPEMTFHWVWEDE